MFRIQYSISFFTWHIFLLIGVACHDYKGFDDSILFKLNWPGKLDSTFSVEKADTVVVTTPDRKEKYKCYMPNIGEEEAHKETNYEGPTPFDLVSTLFSSSTCSYRFESYWTYEVCHGSYVKQFHEEREGKSIKAQEYYLGKWNKEHKDEMAEKFAEAKKNGEKWKTIRIDGVNLPYLEIEMTDGTFCELNGEPRVTYARYVCYPHGKNEVYSFKESATCSYEVVILTPTLCVHPEFNPQEANENVINCIPLDGSPPKPKSLLMMEVENMKQILDVSRGYQRQRVSVISLNQKDGTLKSEIITNDLLPNINKAVAAALSENALDDDSPTSSSSSKSSFLTSKINNLSPVVDFLEGKYCLSGGTGWWKFEFCYGRYVRQFHVDKNGETSLMLGHFNEEAHKEWLKKNPQKRPKKIGSRTKITHFYQDGSVCDETGEKRQTEVQLKCLENSTSMSAVKLFLMEPKMCNYILSVESPLICEIIEKADDDGLIDRKSIENSADQMVNEEENNSQSASDEMQEALESMLN